MDYITVATGRDFADVTPTSGTYGGPALGKLASTKQAEIVELRTPHAAGRRMITQTSPLGGATRPAAFWDEMFSAPGVVRPHYAALARRLETLSADEVTRRQRAADLSFQARGITFAVNQDPSGVEKIMPFDLIPRIILPEEWQRIERGLEQRVRALNLFLHDIYHDAEDPAQRSRSHRSSSSVHAATAARCVRSSRHSACTRTSSEVISCATTAASSSCSRTTFASPPVSRTSSRTAAC